MTAEAHSTTWLHGQAQELQGIPVSNVQQPYIHYTQSNGIGVFESWANAATNSYSVQNFWPQHQRFDNLNQPVSATVSGRENSFAQYASAFNACGFPFEALTHAGNYVAIETTSFASPATPPFFMFQSGPSQPPLQFCTQNWDTAQGEGGAMGSIPKL